MVGGIEGLRWALLGNERPDFSIMIVSATVVAFLLFWGIVYFKKTGQSFVDVI